jgi:hypothetical protein
MPLSPKAIVHYLESHPAPGFAINERREFMAFFEACLKEQGLLPRRRSALLTVEVEDEDDWQPPFEFVVFLELDDPENPANPVWLDIRGALTPLLLDLNLGGLRDQVAARHPASSLESSLVFDEEKGRLWISGRPFSWDTALNPRGLATWRAGWEQWVFDQTLEAPGPSSVPRRSHL